MESAALQSGKIPQALVNRPELPERLAPFWEAFWVLHPSRPMGMSVGAIRIGDIIEYLRLLGFKSDGELRRGVMKVCALDGAWREWNEEQNKGS